MGDSGESRLVTAVIGAGPAGLLFCLVSRLFHKTRGGRPESWPVMLFDMREEYARDHRLRLDPEPFRALERELGAEPPMRELMGFLEAQGFSPPTNLLERRLADLVERRGIRRKVLQLGGPEAPDLAAFRRVLMERGSLRQGDAFSVVAADSAHSAVRRLVRAGTPIFDRTYSVVARLVIKAPNLPETLGPLEQYRLSKLLGSVLDYRLNQNGYAEVDLFVTRGEYRMLERLRASPETPVPLTKEVLASVRAPLFQKIVGYFQRRLGREDGEVTLLSTFRLAHRYIERAAFQVEAVGGTVFLVGDAAVSLPFFRGMACLTACVRSLALVQCELSENPDAPKVRALVERYNGEVAGIRDREVRTVSARGRIVNFAREFARLSALLPFPIQTWLVNAEQPEWGGKVTPALVGNLAVALFASALALSGSTFLAIGLQALGGTAYSAALTWNPAPNPGLRVVWLVQMSVLMTVGPGWVLAEYLRYGRFTAFPLVLWFVMGLAFAAGLVAADRAAHRLHQDL